MPPPSRSNPFPGMNPWLERSWPDVHASLIGYIRDHLAGEIPDDLTVRSEQRVSLTMEGSDQKPGQYRVDVGITESWKNGFPPVWSPNQASGDAGAEGAVQVATPVLRTIEDVVEHWIEIRGPEGDLITVIEVLSPANKVHDRPEYLLKLKTLRQGGVNTVEIDLLRQGRPVVLAAPRGKARTSYCMSVYRACRRRTAEVYPVALTTRLPAIRVPLRPEDADAPLDLQALVNRVYATGRYWKTRYSELPQPSLSAEEQHWARQQLSAAGLAGG